MLVRKEKTATENINVYKILIKRFGEYYSPYRRYYKWDFNVIQTDEIELTFGKKRAGSNVIEKGCFHVYENLSRAEYALEKYQKQYKNEEAFLYKAIIPKGSQYYSDENGKMCSKQLKICV